MLTQVGAHRRHEARRRGWSEELAQHATPSRIKRLLNFCLAISAFARGSASRAFSVTAYGSVVVFPRYLSMRLQRADMSIQIPQEL